MPPPASKSQPARAVLWWWWTTTPAQLAAALLFLVGAGAIQVPEDSVPVNTRSAHPDKITDEMVEQMSHFGMSESQFWVKGDAFQETAAQLVRERGLTTYVDDLIDDDEIKGSTGAYTFEWAGSTTTVGSCSVSTNSGDNTDVSTTLRVRRLSSTHTIETQIQMGVSNSDVDCPSGADPTLVRKCKERDPRCPARSVFNPCAALTNDQTIPLAPPTHPTNQPTARLLSSATQVGRISTTRPRPFVRRRPASSITTTTTRNPRGILLRAPRCPRLPKRQHLCQQSRRECRRKPRTTPRRCPRRSRPTRTKALTVPSRSSSAISTRRTHSRR
jgi:hypothetical protein